MTLRSLLLALALCLALVGGGEAADEGVTGARLLGQPAATSTVGTPTSATDTGSGGQGGTSALPNIAGAAEKSRATTVLVQNLIQGSGWGCVGFAGH